MNFGRFFWTGHISLCIHMILVSDSRFDLKVLHVLSHETWKTRKLKLKEKSLPREIQKFSSRLATFLTHVWASSTNKLRGITFGCRDSGNFHNCQFQGQDYKTSASLCVVLGKEALGFLNALARIIWVGDNGECDDDDEGNLLAGDQSSLVKDVCCSNPCLSTPQLQTHKYVTSFQHTTIWNKYMGIM